MARKGPKHIQDILGPGDQIAEGDSSIVYDAFPNLDANLFELVKTEAEWQKMYHASGEVPRLVCCQGIVDEDGSVPVYRHPSDQALPLLPFTPTVERIRQRVTEIVGHDINHVLIQLYRGGQDYISEHSDKTLDIKRGSKIVNASFGAMRTMRLRTKRSANPAEPYDERSQGEGPQRRKELVPMPDGSVFVLGPASNTRWLHGINADKRPNCERSADELAYEGERISLTFRLIDTFLSSDSTLIWGQGAVNKDRANAHATVNGDEEATKSMIYAFGIENQSTEFDWDAIYGRGFDVLHFRS